MSTWDGLDEDFSSTEFRAVWEACCDGAPPPLLQSRRQRDADAPDGQPLYGP